MNEKKIKSFGLSDKDEKYIDAFKNGERDLSKRIKSRMKEYGFTWKGDTVLWVERMANAIFT